MNSLPVAMGPQSLSQLGEVDPPAAVSLWSFWRAWLRRAVRLEGLPWGLGQHIWTTGLVERGSNRPWKRVLFTQAHIIACRLQELQTSSPHPGPQHLK